MTRLQAPLQFSDMAGNPYSEPLVQLLQHLVNHGSYHRGQVITMLRQAGGETVALDMLFFFREQRRLRKRASTVQSFASGIVDSSRRRTCLGDYSRFAGRKRRQQRPALRRT